MRNPKLAHILVDVFELKPCNWQSARDNRDFARDFLNIKYHQNHAVKKNAPDSGQPLTSMQSKITKKVPAGLSRLRQCYN